jgi:Ca2+:H+ antiporter
MNVGLSVARLLMRWTVVLPVVAVAVLVATWGSKPGTAILAVVGAILAGAVLAAVHHAEVIAHRVGEPFGALILALAVTVIEVGLIVTLMASGDSESSTLARDTVFAAVMITATGSSVCACSSPRCGSTSPRSTPRAPRRRSRRC